jgi:hypothetical protein
LISQSLIRALTSTKSPCGTDFTSDVFILHTFKATIHSKVHLKPSRDPGFQFSSLTELPSLNRLHFDGEFAFLFERELAKSTGFQSAHCVWRRSVWRDKSGGSPVSQLFNVQSASGL